MHASSRSTSRSGRGATASPVSPARAKRSRTARAWTTWMRPTSRSARTTGRRRAQRPRRHRRQAAVAGRPGELRRSIGRRSRTCSPRRRSSSGRCRSTATRRSGADIGYVLEGDRLRTTQDYSATSIASTRCPRTSTSRSTTCALGLARGFTVPREVLKGRDVSIAAVAELKDPTQSSFYKPFKKMPSIVPAADAAKLREAGQEGDQRQGDPGLRATCSASSATTTCPRRAPRWPPKPCPTARRSTASRSTNTPRSISIPTRSTRSGQEQVAKIHAEMVKTMQETRLQGQLRGVPALPAHRSAVLRQDARRTADAHRLGGQAGGRAARQGTSAACRASASPSCRCRPTSRRTTPPAAAVPARLSGQHLRPAVAAALQHAGADPARIGAGPCAAAGAGGRAARPAGVPSRGLHLRLRRRLGPVLGIPGQRDGHLPDALRALRLPHLPDVARLPAGGRHRHPSPRLDAPAGDRFHDAEHRAVRPRDRQRGRSLHQLAGSGAVV